MTNYPQLFLDNTIIELGGVDRLTITEVVDGSFNWLTITLWVLLFVGILVLIYFCWYLLREVNSTDKANHEEL